MAAPRPTRRRRRTAARHRCGRDAWCRRAKLAARPQPMARRPCVRVDSVGFLPHDAKRGYLMSDRAVSGETFRVLDTHGAVAASGTVSSTSRGRWSAAYPDVYPFRFTSLHHCRPLPHQRLRPGDCHVADVPDRELQSAVRPDGQAGRVVLPGPARRRRSGTGPAAPQAVAPGGCARSRLPAAPLPSPRVRRHHLRPTPGPGREPRQGRRRGWLVRRRRLPEVHPHRRRTPTCCSRPASEHWDAARRGRWSARHVTASSGCAGCGISSRARCTCRWGSAPATEPARSSATTTCGGSRRPTPTTPRHRDRYATTDRPVFRAAPPGHRISPNLVGRVSAAFALAAQNDARTHRHRAGSELQAATSLYADGGDRSIHPGRS